MISIAAVFAAVASMAVPAAASSSRRASVGDFFLRPGNLTITKGTRVTWRWVGSNGFVHTVTVKSGPVRFSSAKMTSGSYSHVFARSGTYHLVCRVHPKTMRETIVVR